MSQDLPAIADNNHNGHTTNPVVEELPQVRSLASMAEPGTTGTELLAALTLTVSVAGIIVAIDLQSASCLGYSPADLIGQLLIKLVHLRDQVRLMTELASFLHQPTQPLTTQLCLVAQSGDCLETQVMARALQGSNGATIVLLECRTEAARSMPSPTPAIVDYSSQQLAATLQQQIDQQQLVNTISQHIRASLDLNTILNRTVEEVRLLLQTDRVLIYRFEPDWSGVITVESVASPWKTVLGNRLHDPCFTAVQIEAYRQGRIHIVNDIYNAKLTSCYVELLASLQVRANLAVPIASEQTLWGLLIVHHCQSPRSWESATIDLLKQLATQVAIAVQQAELHHQVQQLNTHLEVQVKERTQQLQQALEFEALVRHITEKVRDSLDESQILQAVAAELGQVMQTQHCIVELYDALHNYATVAYEYATETTLCQGLTHTVADLPELYLPLLQQQPLQFVDQQLDWNPQLVNVTRLACPIFDDQGTLGNLWLVRSRDDCFSEFEVTLVQQVANQCAIAIRQARLYQTAQGQVEKLEKLIALKDEFLTSMTHELRTPLSSISLAIQTLEKVLEPKEWIAKESQIISRTLQILQEACQKEIRLINNLLTLSYVDGGEPLTSTLIDIKVWLPQMVDSFRSRMNDRQQTLELEITEPLPPLQTDRSYLERILHELLSNAYQYTPANQLITVSAFTANHCLNMRICNSGSEIAPEALSHIFEKFYRIPHSDLWEYSGAGLGLTVVQKLSDRIGASIHATSQDQQTTFTIAFPLGSGS
ncbi:GAF domain-containing protein [Pantanalinema rosaneae CENA516]|uniref:sensor histidine kinase n=1 Tax=Pantanalinema rosaneae TaxID=1620701 RepID=UPI003D6E1159